MKNSNDTIEPTTFRLVAQRLDKLRHQQRANISAIKIKSIER
jgi:hypothetical protein